MPRSPSNTREVCFLLQQCMCGYPTQHDRYWYHTVGTLRMQHLAWVRKEREKRTLLRDVSSYVTATEINLDISNIIIINGEQGRRTMRG
jgi:hypothetical protein